MGVVFVNYRSKDNPLGAAGIHDVLARRFGVDRVFRDSVSMGAGDHYPTRLREGLEQADVLVVVIGPRWNELIDEQGLLLIQRGRDWVRWEIARAIERGIPIVPVLLRDVPEDAKPPDRAILPASIRRLADYQTFDVSQKRFGADLDRLCDRLVELVPSLAAGSLTAPPPRRRMVDSQPGGPSDLSGLSVELVNQDPNTAYSVDLDYAGWTPDSAPPTVYTYGDEATSITTAQQGTANTQVIPPYSIVTLKLNPSSTNPVDTTLTAPGGPTVTDVTANTATLTWQPATGADVTRYEVYEQFGTNSVLLGESTSTSFTAQNLQPGTAYTLNVLATDQRAIRRCPRRRSPSPPGHHNRAPAP